MLANISLEGVNESYTNYSIASFRVDLKIRKRCICEMRFGYNPGYPGGLGIFDGVYEQRTSNEIDFSHTPIIRKFL